jgi:hypothetical protein
MKIKDITSKVIHNKYVLYFVLFLSVVNILGYMVMGKLTPMFFFAIIAYLVYNFSKNMIIVLGSALILTNILMVGNGIKEGLENKSQSSDTSTKTTPETSSKPKPKVTQQTNNDLPVIPAQTDEAINEEEVVPSTNVDTTGDEGMINKKRSRLDYASTVEDAYGDLNNILGGEGIKQLTTDTQKLMTQQLQLADAMKSMTPVMENAKSLLHGFDMDSLNNLASLAKSFTSGGGGGVPPNL